MAQKTKSFAYSLGSAVNQLRAEIHQHVLDQQLTFIDDPIGSLHEDVAELSGIIYTQIQHDTEHLTVAIQLDDLQYRKYSAALNQLEIADLLQKKRAGHIVLNQLSHTYIMYMANKFDDSTKLKQFSGNIKDRPSGKWLNGRELARESQLPLPVVHACLKQLELTGYGFMSKRMNVSLYMPIKQTGL